MVSCFALTWLTASIMACLPSQAVIGGDVRKASCHADNAAVFSAFELKQHTSRETRSSMATTTFEQADSISRVTIDSFFVWCNFFVLQQERMQERYFCT